MGDKTTDKGWVATAGILHYGVKGMKWGRRKDRSAMPVTVTQKGKKLKITGGQHHPASADAVAARSLGQVAKKSGVHALSNNDLKKYNERLNLEANAQRLTYGQKNAGAKFVAGLLGNTGKTVAQQAANEAASRQVKKLLVKGAVTAVAA